MYVYELSFSYRYKLDNETYRSSFALGYYSTKQKARERIAFYKDLPGFRDHSVKNFRIDKIKINTSGAKDKNINILYQASYFYITDDDCDGGIDYIPRISEEEAIQDAEEIKRSEEFKKYGGEINIGNITIDKWNDWSEGFDRY